MWIVHKMRWIMLVSGVLTATIGAACSSRVAAANSKGEFEV